MLRRAPAYLWLPRLPGHALLKLFTGAHAEFLVHDGVLLQGDAGRTSVVEVEGRCRDLAVHGNLTAREEEVLAELCLGKSKAYIARELGMSEATAKSHVRSIYAKLGVHSKNELQELIGL